jgi:hypothetical protein
MVLVANATTRIARGKKQNSMKVGTIARSVVAISGKVLSRYISQLPLNAVRSGRLLKKISARNHNKPAAIPTSAPIIMD